MVVGCSDVFEFGIFTCLSVGGATGATRLCSSPHPGPIFSLSCCSPLGITYCHKTAQLCPITGPTTQQSNCCCCCCTAAGHWTPLNRQQSLVSPLHLALTWFNHPQNHCSPPTLTPLRLKICFLLLLLSETRNPKNYVVRRFLAAAATRHHCCGAGATVGGAAEQPVVGEMRMRNTAYLAIDVTHWREAQQMQPMQVNFGS